MANPPVLPSVTGANGPRMCRAVVDLGGDMMRDILYHHVKPAVVMSYVLASRYYRNHPLNTHQISILGNVSVRGDYSECDITLIYSLLRNLTPTSTSVCPTAGWGKQVSAGDMALGDDIERIRELRNTMYGHVATTSLPTVCTTTTCRYYMTSATEWIRFTQGHSCHRRPEIRRTARLSGTYKHAVWTLIWRLGTWRR